MNAVMASTKSAKKSTAKVAHPSKLLAVVAPRFHGRPPCPSQFGAVASRVPAAVFSEGPKVEFWDLSAMDTSARFNVGEQIYAVAVDPGGRRAAALGDGRVHLLTPGGEHVTFDAPKTRYVSFDSEGNLWTATTGAVTRRTAGGAPAGEERATHDLPIYATRGDGVHVVTRHEEILLLGPDGERRVPTHAHGHIAGVSDARPWIAMIDESESKLTVLDLDTGAVLFTREEPWYRNASRLSFSADGERLAIIGPAVHVFDIPSGERVFAYHRDGCGFVGGFSGDDLYVSYGGLCRFERGAVDPGPDGDVDALAWSSDGARVVYAETTYRGAEPYWSSAVAVAGAGTSAELARVALEDRVTGVAFVDGDTKIAVLREGDLTLYDAASLTPVGPTLAQGGEALAASPDGASLLVAGKALLRVDAANLAVKKRLAAHDDGFRCPAWSADGSLAAAVQGEQRVRAFDAAGKAAGELKVPSSDTSEVQAVGVLGDELLAATTFGIHVRARAGGAVKGRGPKDKQIVGRCFDIAGRVAAEVDGDTVLLAADGSVDAVLADIVGVQNVIVAPDGARAAVLRDEGAEIWSLR